MMKAVALVAAMIPSISEASTKECLQQNIFFEARNQPVEGQIAIGWVTLNRVENPFYPDSVCEVVFQNRQFSWTQDGKPDYPSNNVLEQEAWEYAGAIADYVMVQYNEGATDPTDGSVMFHADYINPYWTTSYRIVEKIGSHIFYGEL